MNFCCLFLPFPHLCRKDPSLYLNSEPKGRRSITARHSFGNKEDNRTNPIPSSPTHIGRMGIAFKEGRQKPGGAWSVELGFSEGGWCLTMNLARGLFYKIASPWGPSTLAMHLCSHACLSIGAQFCTLMSWGLLCSRVLCHFFGGPLILLCGILLARIPPAGLGDTYQFTSKYRQWPDISSSGQVHALWCSHRLYHLRAAHPKTGSQHYLPAAPPPGPNRNDLLPHPGATKTRRHFQPLQYLLLFHFLKGDGEQMQYLHF